MSKPWDGTGLSDFKSWLGATHQRDGLVYRGDVDFIQFGPRGMMTVLEFKNAGEFLSRGQRSMLQVLARNEGWEVRLVREMPGTSPDNPDRLVMVSAFTRAGLEHGEPMPLSTFAKWVDSRAYRSGAALEENRPAAA